LLGTPGNGTNSTGFFKDAVSASLATFLPVTVRNRFAQEGGIDTREDWGFRKMAN
jgi:hypothetical protein